MNDRFHFSLKGRFDFGLGKSARFPQGMVESYRQARAALDNRSLLTASGRIHAYSEHIDATANLYFSDFEERFRAAVHRTHEMKIAEAVAPGWMRYISFPTSRSAN